MSDTDKNAILIRALEASGSEREAQLARAILGDPAASAAPAESPPAPAAPERVPEIPAAATVPAGIAAAAAGPQPPPGTLPLRSYADVEALSDKEFDARYAEVQGVLRSGER